VGPSGWTGYAPLYIRGHEHHRGHPLAWLLFALLLLVLLLVIANLVATLTRRHRGPWRGGPWGSEQRRSPDGGLDEASAILRARYARGEITREEFLQASVDLAAPR
jgi:uncharacterized membrane protein